MHRVIALIGANPALARERTEYGPPVRIHHHGRHFIVYMVEDDGILVVRILRDNVDPTRHLPHAE